MGLEKVIQEIYQKGDEEVKKIKAEAESEAKRIIEEAQERAKDILRKAREEAEREAEALRRREISSVSLEMKRLMLNKQKELLDSVFESLVKRIKEMDLETKRKLMKKLIENNAVEGMRVYSAKEDEELVKNVINELKLKLSYAGNIDCLGGVILESPDGEIVIDLTFDKILSRVQEMKVGEVSKILFG